MKNLMLMFAVVVLVVSSTSYAHACGGGRGLAMNALRIACSMIGCDDSLRTLDRACDEVANLDNLMAQLESTGSIPGTLGTTNVVSSGGFLYGETVTTVRQRFSESVAGSFLDIEDISEDIDDLVGGGYVPGSADESAIMADLAPLMGAIDAQTAAIMNTVERYSAIQFRPSTTTTTTCTGLFGCTGDRPER